MMPTKADLARLEDLSPEQKHELAEGYIDLFGKLLDAMHDGGHGFAVVEWAGDRFKVSGHLPREVFEKIKEQGHE